MAYKSRVTHKRYYDTFAGSPATSKTNELSFLVETLKEDVIPAVYAGSALYVDKKVEDAEAKMEELRTKYEPEEIEAILMEGNIPELSNYYAQKVVEGQHGRIMASKVIKDIEKNIHLYNPDQQSLHTFYKPYMQDLSGKSNSFITGFSGIFTQYSTDEAIKDAEYRSNMAGVRKIDNMSGVIGVATNAADAFDLAMSHTFKVNGIDQYATNKEVNEAIVNLANSILLDEVPVDKIDFAISLLEHDRGLGTGGNKIGSLLDTAIDNPSNQYIAKLHGDLLRKKEAMLKDADANATRIKQEKVDDIYKRTLKLQVAGELTEVLKNELQNELIDVAPDLLINWQAVTSSTYEGKASFDQIDIFEQQALLGGFTSDADVIQQGIELGIPREVYLNAITWNNKALNLKRNGLELIWNTNFEYKNVYATIQDRIDTLSLVAEAAGTILSDPELKKWLEAKDYFEKAVTFQEDKWLNENYEIQTFDRQNFGKSILDYLETRLQGDYQVGELQNIEAKTNVMEDGIAQTVIKQLPITQAFFDESDVPFPEIIEQRETMLANMANADFSQFMPINKTYEDAKTYAHNVGLINEVLGNTYINLLDSKEGQNVLLGMNQFANDILRNIDDQVALDMFKGLGLLDDTYTAEDIQRAKRDFYEYFNQAIQSLKSTDN